MAKAGARAATGTEVELKYSVPDPEALAAWIAGAALGEAGMALGEERVSELDDRYVDTAAGGLRGGGFAARLRTEGDRVSISLKGRTSEGDTSRGRHERAEVEGPAADSPDPAEWPESEARSIVERLAAGDVLRERFRIHQRRREWQITGDGAGEATISLQAIEVYRAGQLLGEQDALEIELASGDEEILRAVARVLEPTGLVEPETTSKEELAETLVSLSHGDGSRPRDDEDDSFEQLPDAIGGVSIDGSTDVAATAEAGEPATDGSAAPPMVVPKSPGMRVEDSLADAGRKVLGMHLARMLAREAGTRAGEVEDLHKMRVATRRMRATWRTFEGAYRPKRAARYVRELKVVADRLGAVRDLDVQLEGLAAYGEATPIDAPLLSPLADAWQARRDAARDELLATLDGNGYRHFVEDYRAFVDAPGDDAEGPATEPGTPTRVRDTAAGRIWVAYEHLRAHHETLAWADVPTLHEVRIAGKRLRYALESFREVLGPEVDGLIARVTALQDHLGELNDADLAAHLTREFLVREAGRLPGTSTAALGRYLAACEREVQARRRSLPAVWRQVVGLRYRRALGRALSSL